MNSQKKQVKSKKNPITAKNIAIVQEKYEKEVQLCEKSKRKLNGRVESEQIVENGSVCKEDFEYEFLYSVSDDENADGYSYEFEAYPVFQRISDDEHAHHEDCEISSKFENTVQKKENGILDRPVGKQSASMKKERAKSASISVSEKRVVQGSRPKSASHVVDNNIETTAPKSAMKARKQSSEIPKEVAFRDSESVVSKSSSGPHLHNNQNKAGYQRRKSVSYDPDLEKASAFIHGGGKNFSRSNTSLAPVRHGMKHLQMNYTETNLETNQAVIFIDLLKSSHQRSQIRLEQIQHIERRLEVKRKNPLYSTSFYEHKKIPDPFQRNKKKTSRSAAQKKIERKEKIKQITDEIHTGYVPTQLTMKIADREEVEAIGKSCRYLRC